MSIIDLVQCHLGVTHSKLSTDIYLLDLRETLAQNTVKPPINEFVATKFLLESSYRWHSSHLAVPLLPEFSILIFGFVIFKNINFVLFVYIFIWKITLIALR